MFDRDPAPVECAGDPATGTAGDDAGRRRRAGRNPARGCERLAGPLPVRGRRLPETFEIQRRQVVAQRGMTPHLLTLPGTQAVGALAGVPAGLRHPIPDGLGRRLELPRQSLRRAPRPDQLDHLPAELRRIRRSRFRHCRYLLLPTGSGVHETGATPEITIFDGADHAFFNDTRAETYHARYAAECWTRMLAFYRRHLA